MDLNLGEVDEVLKTLNIGRGFRIFGGFGFLISIWSVNELALKISLATFIFGSFAKVFEMINKTDFMKSKIFLQALIWLMFTGLYVLVLRRVNDFLSF